MISIRRNSCTYIQFHIQGDLHLDKRQLSVFPLHIYSDKHNNAYMATEVII